MKTYYLNDSPLFFQHFNDFDEIITWTYRWNNRIMISDELHKLFSKHFNYN